MTQKKATLCFHRNQPQRRTRTSENHSSKRGGEGQAHNQKPRQRTHHETPAAEKASRGDEHHSFAGGCATGLQLLCIGRTGSPPPLATHRPPQGHNHLLGAPGDSTTTAPEVRGFTLLPHETQPGTCKPSTHHQAGALFQPGSQICANRMQDQLADLLLTHPCHAQAASAPPTPSRPCLATALRNRREYGG